MPKVPRIKRLVASKEPIPGPDQVVHRRNGYFSLVGDVGDRDLSGIASPQEDECCLLDRGSTTLRCSRTRRAGASSQGAHWGAIPSSRAALPSMRAP